MFRNKIVRTYNLEGLKEKRLEFEKKRSEFSKAEKEYKEEKNVFKEIIKEVFDVSDSTHYRRFDNIGIFFEKDYLAIELQDATGFGRETIEEMEKILGLQNHSFDLRGGGNPTIRLRYW